MDASHYQFPGAVEAVSCLDSAFSVLDKPDPLSHCVSHVPDFVCQECLQLDIQRSFFLTPCSGYAPAQSTRPLPSGQYIGRDNRCPVYHVTFVLRYLAVAQTSHVKPRSGANRSCRRVTLSGSTEKVFDDILKPLLLIEARRLRTVARKMGTYHVPARWVAQRTRKPPSYDGECPPKPAKRLRWAPVLCLPSVAIERPFPTLPRCWLSCAQASSYASTGLLSENATGATASVDVGRSLPSSPHVVQYSDLSASLKECLIVGRHFLWIRARAQWCPLCGGQQSHARFVRSALRGYALFACVLVLFPRVPLHVHHLFLVRVLQDLTHSIECVTHCLDLKSPHAFSYSGWLAFFPVDSAVLTVQVGGFLEHSQVSGVVALRCCTCDQRVHFCHVSVPWLSHRRC